MRASTYRSNSWRCFMAGFAGRPHYARDQVSINIHDWLTPAQLLALVAPTLFVVPYGVMMRFDPMSAAERLTVKNQNCTQLLVCVPVQQREVGRDFR